MIKASEIGTEYTEGCPSLFSLKLHYVKIKFNCIIKCEIIDIGIYKNKKWKFKQSNTKRHKHKIIWKIFWDSMTLNKT